MEGCQQDHPASRLRDAISSTFDHVVPDVVAALPEFGDEIFEDLVSLDRGNVLHRDDVRTKIPGQSTEFIEETPLVIRSGLVSLTVGRKGLTWSTAGEDPDLAVIEERCDLLR